MKKETVGNAAIDLVKKRQLSAFYNAAIRMTETLFLVNDNAVCWNARRSSRGPQATRLEVTDWSAARSIAYGIIVYQEQLFLSF